VARRSGKKGGDEALVQALAGGASVPVAARAAAVSERTVYRRLEDPAFCEAVARLRSRMTGQAIGRLSATPFGVRTPLPVVLRLAAGPKELWGIEEVYCWFRHTSVGPYAVIAPARAG
jgi:hypothetical protein